jgi:hypothetical protein
MISVEFVQGGASPTGYASAPWLELIWVDGGYNAWQVNAAVAKVPKMRNAGLLRRGDFDAHPTTVHR